MGTVEARQIPSTASRSSRPPTQDRQLVAGSLRLGREAPVLAELLALVEAERGLRVADVDGEQHGRSVGARD